MNIPASARVFQLRENSKEPANTSGHLKSESIEFFVPTNPNIGWVLGIEPKASWVCLDIDYPDRVEAQELMRMAERAPTRVVGTPHGFQYIWEAPPAFPCLRANLSGKEGTFGQLLSHGYIVAAGAHVLCSGKKHADGKSCGVKTYVVRNETAPQIAPPWICALAAELTAKAGASSSKEERGGVPVGSHDKFGADLAYNLRKWGGLDESAIATFFREGGLKGVVNVLEGYNESAPFTQDDADRWARSAARKTPPNEFVLPAALPTETPSDDEAESFENATFVEAPLRWWVRGFIPQGYLIALYGQGGRGKSSLGSWVFGEVTRRGSACAMWCIEESAKLFAARAIIGGADRKLVLSVKNASDWVFPRDADRLRALIRKHHLKFLWFDSLYSHFEMIEGMNVSERARKILSPLASLAREEDCTIMGVFHENKGGAFLGATEMENVVRVLLKATRSLRGSRSPLKVKVAKTNMPFRPETYLKFSAEKKILCDPITGEVQLEEIEPGRMEPLLVPITVRIEDGLLADEEMEAVLEAANGAQGGGLGEV